MNIIFPILLISLVVALGFLFAFFWAVRSGQYEDDYTPSMRMLFEDTVAPEVAEEEVDSSTDIS